MSLIIVMTKKVLGVPKITEEMMEEAGFEKLDINSSEDKCVLARFAFISEADQVKNDQKVEIIILPKDGELKAGIIGFSIERLDHVEYKIFRIGSHHTDSMTEEVVDPYGIDDYIEIKELIKAMYNGKNITIARTIPGSAVGVKIDDSIYFGSIQNNKIIFKEKIEGEHKIIIEKMTGLIVKLFISNKEIIIKS